MKKDIKKEKINKVDKQKEKTKVSNQPLETSIYNQKGEVVGKFSLPESIFNLPWNADLVHQVVTAMQANARIPVAHAKSRAEVSGGGKKPWRQKGTGRARHGSSRSPIWVGGGVAHGPLKDKKYSQKINKKMKIKALFTILSQKFKKGQIVFIEELNLKKIKTKDAVQIIKDLSLIDGLKQIIKGQKKNTYFTVPAKNDFLKKSFANIKNIKIDEVKNINPVDLIKHKHLIISHPNESLAFLETKIFKKEK
jgi:large subunit ribosomal protein L4